MISGRIHGIPQTKAALARIEAEVKIATPEAVQASGEVVQREMSARAPRDTGSLASAITTDVDSGLGEATSSTGSNVPYDRFVQGGTRYMAAQAYGESAASAAVPGIIAVQTAVYRAAVE